MSCPTATFVAPRQQGNRRPGFIILEVITRVKRNLCSFFRQQGVRFTNVRNGDLIVLFLWPPLCGSFHPGNHSPPSTVGDLASSGTAKVAPSPAAANIVPGPSIRKRPALPRV